MRVLFDLSCFLVLEHIETEMIGNDRPLIIGPGDDAELAMSLGMVPKLTYNTKKNPCHQQ